MTNKEVELLLREEIISDVLAQVCQRLRGDCNLRNSDGYSGGYLGEIGIKLNRHRVTGGLDEPEELTTFVAPLAESQTVEEHEKGMRFYAPRRQETATV